MKQLFADGKINPLAMVYKRVDEDVHYYVWMQVSKHVWARVEDRVWSKVRVPVHVHLTNSLNPRGR